MWVPEAKLGLTSADFPNTLARAGLEVGQPHPELALIRDAGVAGGCHIASFFEFIFMGSVK